MVLSANWKSLGSDWYVNLDSAKKYGDIGTIDIRYKDAFGDASFDCKRRVVITPERWADKESIKDDDSPISQMFNSACSKWYEVWKR